MNENYAYQVQIRAINMSQLNQKVEDKSSSTLQVASKNMKEKYPKKEKALKILERVQEAMYKREEEKIEPNSFKPFIIKEQLI